MCFLVSFARDNADLYDAFGNYLGGDLDSGSESDTSDYQQQQQQQQPGGTRQVYDEDDSVAPLEGLDQEDDDGMQVDGKLNWTPVWHSLHALEASAAFSRVHERWLDCLDFRTINNYHASNGHRHAIRGPYVDVSPQNTPTCSTADTASGG